MNLAITLIIILGISFLVKYLGRKIRIPSVVSFIVVGLFFGTAFFRENFIGSNITIISTLGTIGLFILMFLAGMETSWKMLNDEKKDSAYIATFAFLTPLILGFCVFMILGFSVLISIVVGVSMSITAEATKARVLLDLNKLRTKLGSAMMGAGIIDDVLGLLVFFIVSLIYYFKGNEIFFTLGVLGAFFAGIIVQTKVNETKAEKYSKKILMLFVPLFFISMGLNFDFNSLILKPFLLILIISVALVGKISGVFLTKPFTKLKFKQLFAIGWAMNSRGAIELGLALTAFKIGIINSEIYSGLVVMALVTTLIFPFILTRIIKKNPGIMN